MSDGLGECDVCGKAARWARVVKGCSEHKDRLRAVVDSVTQPAQATNSDYAAALRVIEEYFDAPLRRGLDINDMREWCKERLNSVKAPNCA